MVCRNVARFVLSACVAALTVGAASAQEWADNVSLTPPREITRTNESGNPVHEQLQSRERRYQLRPTDVLELRFPFTPEFDQTVSVQPDGYVSLRGADSIRVEGQTLPEVTRALRMAYATILHDPVIDVELKDFEKPYFIVGGQVEHPGKYDLRGRTTTTEAVAIAGGFKDSAKCSQVLLFHQVPDGWLQVRKLNLKKMLKQANLDEDAYLKAGDFLYVPQNNMSKFSRFIPTSSLGLYTNPFVP
jgi:polysaccharide biosynthesis/export protein